MRKFLTMPKRRRNEADQNTLTCAQCHTVFSSKLTACPQCGSSEWLGYTEANPYSSLPLELFLQICGHIFWIGGTIFFIAFLWQTDSPDQDVNRFYIYMAITSLVAGVLLSSLYFALSEIILRILRLQRRLRAFHNNYKARYSAVQRTKRQSSQRHRRVGRRNKRI